MAELALLKPDFESKILYPRRRFEAASVPARRFVFASKLLKAAISPVYEALWALLSAL